VLALSERIYGALVVVAVLEGSAAAAGTGPGVVGAGVARVTGALVGGAVDGAIVVVAGWVGAGVVTGSTRASGFGSGFGSGLAVGVTVRTVGGVDGSTTMMLGSGAAVAGTARTGVVNAVTVVLSVAASVV
jgi:hypothetical protein